MDRRAFLEVTSKAVGALTLVGCDERRDPTVTPGAEPTATVGSSSATSSGDGPSPTTLDELKRRLAGRLLSEGDADYRSRQLLNDSAFDRISPRAIAEVRTAADVALCIGFCRSTGLPLSVMGGGHSYLGASTGLGLVVNLRELSNVELDSTGRALVGGGAQLIDVYAKLAAQGRAIPAGSCPTVGIGGLALGGGHGLTSRAWGLTCDRVTEFELVDANGAVLRVTKEAHPDLFWALRGGGGSFGVVTRFMFETEVVPPFVTTFMLKYRWQEAGAALMRWMGWLRDLSPSISVVARLATTRDLVVAGMHLGQQPETERLVSPLLEGVDKRSIQGHDFLGAMLLEAGCSQRSVAECHVAANTPGGQLKRALGFAAASHYFEHPLDEGNVAKVMKHLEDHARIVGTGAASIQFDAYGGVINGVPRNATAFVHRTAYCSAQYASFFGKNDDRPHRLWVAAVRDALAPVSNGESYQNYNDAGLTNWERAYYAENSARLRAIKRAYDPGNLFRFAQSIPSE